MPQNKATIDGVAVAVNRDETILEASRRIGAYIPTLCHVDGASPEGGCRLCLVETDSKGNLKAACHTPIQPGMEICTHSPRLTSLRRDILSLMIGMQQYHADAVRGMHSRLRSLVSHFGINGLLMRSGEDAAPTDISHTYLRFNPTLCIQCRKCLNVCQQIQGQFVYGVEGRGIKSHIVFGAGERFADSPCVSCGACVDQCPTGAVTDRDRVEHPAVTSTTDSVCGYCGVGCRVRVQSASDRIVRIAGVPGAAVNNGHLCLKGRYAHSYQHHPDRLTRPLLRHHGQLRPVSWDEAIGWVADRLTRIRDTVGPDALGVITSSRSTNEAAYLFQKLFRVTLGTNNIDCCARVCHSSTALALRTTTGVSAATASFVDIERAACIVVAGANPTESHPVLGARIKQAVLRGARLVVIDPRRIELAEYADVHLRLLPGSNVALFNALAKILVERGQCDSDYVRHRTEGFDELVGLLGRLSLTHVQQVTGVPMDTMLEAVSVLAAVGPVLFVHGLGLSEQTQGTESVMTLCNMAMLTGSIGKPGAGLLPLRGQNNVQGNADMGAMPDYLTGYESVNAPRARAMLAEIWGKAPPTSVGKTNSQMIQAAVEGSFRGLWVQGEDLAQSEPNQSRVIEALQRLELLVVQDLFMCQTAQYAHLVLPAAGVFEQEGTFTNAERRIQLVRPCTPPPGEAKPDWRVALALANAMGETWSYESSAQVMEEISRVAPALFGGVHYDRLAGDGLQWPCPTPDHPGTASLHPGGFARGKGLLTCVEYVPPPETVSADFPYLLITGRVLEHYNVGTMTRRTFNRDLVPTDALEINPRDAQKMGVLEGQRVAIESRWGNAVAPVHLTPRVSEGTLFLSFHNPETRANRLVGPHLDPHSHCPAYKRTAVRISPLDPGKA